MAEATIKEEPMDYEFIAPSGTTKSHGNTPQPNISCADPDPVFHSDDEMNQPGSVFEQIFIKEELEVESPESMKTHNTDLQTSLDNKPAEDDVIKDSEVFNIQEEVEITIDDVKIETDNWKNELFLPDKTKEVKLINQCPKQEFKSSKNKSMENTQEDIKITIKDDKIQTCSKENTGNFARRRPGRHQNDSQRLNGRLHVMGKSPKGSFRCQVCTKKKVRKETVYFCKTCHSKPYLHPDTCFEVYHTKKDF